MSEPVKDKRCDDAEVMRIWRECGLPEYFLGNGGTNAKLVEFAKRAADAQCADLTRKVCEMEDDCLEADFLRSQFEALGIVVETSVEDWGNGTKATIRLTRNALADDLARKVAELQSLCRDLVNLLERSTKYHDSLCSQAIEDDEDCDCYKAYADAFLAKLPKE
jgi:hypothetical protein